VGKPTLRAAQPIWRDTGTGSWRSCGVAFLCGIEEDDVAV